MPTYAYACTACDHRFEAQQSFSDDALTECPECSGRLRKLFNSVGIVFKGSGFYRTDSRGKETSSSSTSSGGSESSSNGSSGTSSADSSGSGSTSSSTSSTSSASGSGASGSSGGTGSSSSTPATSGSTSAA